MPTAYCLLSNSNYKPFKMRYLYDLVRTLGLSVIEIPLLATDYKLLTKSLTSNDPLNSKSTGIYPLPISILYVFFTLP
jgi:hypothetical protein